jgi:hypothetical protein
MGLFDRTRSAEDRAEHGRLGDGSGTLSPLSRRADIHATAATAGIDAEVREHLDRLVAVADTDLDGLTTEQFDSMLTSRLVGSHGVHASGFEFSYATPFADHVHEVLSLDLPSTVVMLPDTRVAETSRRLPALVERARQNLATLAVTSTVDVERVGDGDGAIWGLVGDSPYTASFARFLDLMVRRLLPDTDPRHGFVFAIPYRHAILVQPCATPREARDALELVPAYADALYADGAGPLSRHTYHWLDRRISCLTREDADGSLVMAPTPFLQQLLDPRRHAG